MTVTNPWYHQQYAARAGVLFEGAARLFGSTTNAIYTDTQTDVFAVFMSFLVFGLVAALLLYFYHNSKK